MFASLSGQIQLIEDNALVLNVGGVGYLVYCSNRTLSRLGKGQDLSLLIETHVREDHIHLYGFMEKSERDWFRILTTVQGVGTKVALSILSILGPEDLIRSIASADKTALGRADGVGPKLAARLVTELKDKAGKMMLGAVSSPTTQAVPGSEALMGDAISALINLGYGRTDAYSAVQAAVKGGTNDVQSIIRAALKELAA